VECLGETFDFKYTSMLASKKKFEKGLLVIYRYQPGAEKNTLTSDIKFPNEAGSLITNDKLKYIKI